MEFAAARQLVFRETLQRKLPSLMTARASAYRKITVLAKKSIALGLGQTELFDNNMAVVRIRALCSPFYGRAADLAITVLAGLEKVFSANSRMPKELVCERPGFAANVTIPSR